MNIHEYNTNVWNIHKQIFRDRTSIEISCNRRWLRIKNDLVSNLIDCNFKCNFKQFSKSLHMRTFYNFLSSYFNIYRAIFRGHSSDDSELPRFRFSRWQS